MNRICLKRAVILISVAALLTFSVTTYLALIPPAAAFETRRQTLIRTLSLGQNPDGGFLSFSGLVPSSESCLPCTAEALIMSRELNSLEFINVSSAIDYIVSKQNQATGSFSFGTSPLGLYMNTVCVKALSTFNQLQLINGTKMVELVLDHYNESSGTFYEPEGGSGLPMVLLNPDPYNQSNIVSTYLAISILDDLESLEVINTSKTIDWVADCIGVDGGFRPFPNASGVSASGFVTGYSGSGLPYTYCAIQILNILNQLETQNIVDEELLIEFIWNCQSSLGDFKIIPQGDPWFGAAYDREGIWETLYAFTALNLLGGLDANNEGFNAVITNTLDRQRLAYQFQIFDVNWVQHGYSSPFFLAYGQNYGLFSGDLYDIGTSFCAVQILALAEALSYLDAFSPRCLAVWQYMVISGICCIVLFIISTIVYVKLKQASVTR